MLTRHPDVFIAGAGPVGLFAALSLARKGVSVQIADTGVWACAHTYALALHPATVQLLRQAGFPEDTLREACGLESLAFYEGSERHAEIHLKETGGPLLVLPQGALEETLERLLAETGVRVMWRHEVTGVEEAGRRVHVTLNRYEEDSRGYVVARTEWVVAKTWTTDVAFAIGADGYRSAVRRSLGLKFPEVGSSACYAVFEFESDADIPDEVRVTIGENTTDVLWPLGGGLFRWSFELPGYVDPGAERWASYRRQYGVPFERTKDRLRFTRGDVNILEDSQLRELASERAPWFKGSFGRVGWRTVVRFERRLAEAFGRGRCWLAGDAAHLAGPIGVQSLNVGLAEAQALSGTIARALDDPQARPGFEDYESRFMSEWKRLQGLDGGLNVYPHSDPWIERNRDRLVACLPAFGQELSALAGQIGLHV